MPDYMVSVNGAEEKPIRATSQSSARNWAVRNAVAVRVMKPEDYIALGRSGGSIPEATAADEQPNPEPSKSDPPAGGELEPNKSDPPASGEIPAALDPNPGTEQKGRAAQSKA